MDIFPYLTFNGNCEEAMNFYAQAINGKLEHVMRFKEMPEDDSAPAAMKTPEAAHMILNSVLTVKGHELMASDRIPGEEHIISDTVSINITVDTKEEAITYFTNLSSGGRVTMPLMETFWAESFGSLQDKFGIYWLICYFGSYKT